LAEELARRKAEFEKQYAEYQEIVKSSQADDGMKGVAWKRLTEAWAVKDAGAEPQGLMFDEKTGLLKVVGLGGQQGKGLVVDLGSGVAMEFVWIPPGEFMMGSPASEAQRAGDEVQHRVALTKGFWMGKYEVTQRQYRQITGENPSNFKGDDLPVEQVDWNQAGEFCQKAGKVAGVAMRLPTEAEWEYACRAGAQTAFHYGDSLDASMANFDGNYPYGNGVKGEYRQKTTPVGTFKPNAWGCMTCTERVGMVWRLVWGVWWRRAGSGWRLVGFGPCSARRLLGRLRLDLPFRVPAQARSDDPVLQLRLSCRCFALRAFF